MDNELEIVANEGLQDLEVVTEVATVPNKTQQYLAYGAGIVGAVALGYGLCKLVEYGVKIYKAKKAEKQAASEPVTDEAEKPAKES